MSKMPLNIKKTRNKNFAQKISPKKYLFLFLGLLFMVFFTASINAFRSAVDIRETYIKENNIQRITYDYRVHTSPSILYPRGSEPLPPEREEGYFADITNRIELTVTGEVINTPPVGLEGNMHITLYLQSDKQWKKMINLTPKVETIPSDEGILKFQSSFTLPLSDATQMAEAITEEIGVRPRELRLIVESSLESQALTADTPTKSLFSQYDFVLSGKTIEPKGDLIKENKNSISEEVITANHIDFFGYLIEVETSRTVFPILSLLALLINGITFYSDRKKHLPLLDARELELQKIKKQYGKKLITMKDLNEFPSHLITIKLKTFKELDKIAEELEKPLFHHEGSDSKEINNAFYVFGDGTIYHYHITG